MLKIYETYIARALVSAIALTLLILVSLSGLIKFVEQLRQIGRGDYDMVVAGIYVLLSLPKELEMFFPMAVLIGGLIGLGALANNSELIVMQSAGLSRFNIITAAMKTAIFLILVLMVIGEFVTPNSEAKAKEIRLTAISGGSLFSTSKLVWAKDGDNFVSIGEVTTQSLIQDVSVYEFNEDLSLKRLTYAKSANFRDNSWWFNDVFTTDFKPDLVQTNESLSQRWESTLTPDKLGIVAVKPETLSIQGLHDYIGYLDNNNQDSSRYELAYWRKLLQPITVSVMLLMALSFIFGPLRSVTMGVRIIMGVLTGFGFFVANEMFGPLSLVYQLHPVIGALLPSVLFLIVATALLRR